MKTDDKSHLLESFLRRSRVRSTTVVKVCDPAPFCQDILNGVRLGGREAVATRSLQAGLSSPTTLDLK